MNKKIFNVLEVANLLQTNRARVYVLLQTGVLEGIRLVVNISLQKMRLKNSLTHIHHTIYSMLMPV